LEKYEKLGKQNSKKKSEGEISIEINFHKHQFTL